MPIHESVVIQSRPGPNGSRSAVLDADGVKAYSPGVLAQDNSGVAYVIHDRHQVSVQVLAATVDQPIFIPAVGVWVVSNVISIRRVVGSDGSAVTADIMAAASGTAPASGTTQLASADSINLKSPAADIIANHDLAASLTEVGPGSYFGLNVAGTLTAVVANITVSFRRVR